MDVEEALRPYCEKLVSHHRNTGHLTTLLLHTAEALRAVNHETTEVRRRRRRTPDVHSPERPTRRSVRRTRAFPFTSFQAPASRQRPRERPSQPPASTDRVWDDDSADDDAATLLSSFL